MAEFPEVGLQAIIDGLAEFQRGAQMIQDSMGGVAEASEQAGQSSETSAAGLGVLTGVVAGLTTAGIGILVEGLTALAGAMWEMVSVGPEVATQLDDMTRSLQAQMGVTEEVAAGYRGMAEELFAVGGEGDNLAEVGDALSKVGRITDLAGEELQTLTESALIFSDTFGSSVGGSIRTVNQVTRLFGEEGTRVFDMLAKSIQETGDPSGDLVSSVSSFAPAFKEAGFSAEQMFGVLAAGVDAGATGFNQVGFAVRELFFSLQDGSDKTREYLEALGLPVDEFLAGLQSGAISGPEAMSTIIKALGGVEDELMRNQIGFNLFGRSWKQLGPSVLLAMDPATAALADFEGAVARADEVVDKGLGATWERFKRQLQVSVGEGFLPVLDTLTEGLTPAIESFASWLRGPGQEALAGFGSMVADQVGPALAGLGPFVAEQLIPVLENLAEWIKKEGIPWLKKAIDWVKKEGIPGIKKFVDVMISDVIPALKKLGEFVVDVVIPATVRMVDAIQDVIETMQEWLRAIAGFVADAIRAWEDLRAGTEAAWDAIRSAIDSAVSAIQDAVTAAWREITSTIEGALRDIQNAVTTAWNDIVATIKRVLSDIASEISTRWNEILTTIKNALSSIATEVSTKWNEILNSIKTALSSIGTEISTRWNEYLTAIKNALSSIATEVSTKWNEMLNSIKTALSNIGSEISTRWNEFLTNIKNVLSSILTEVSTKFQQVYDEVKAKLESLATIPNLISATLIGIGTAVVNHILSGIRNFATFVSDVLAQLQSWFNSVYTSIAAGFQAAIDIGRVIVLRIKEGIQGVASFVDDVVDILKGWFGQLTSTATDWYESVLSIGGKVVDRIKQGIEDAWQDFLDWLGGLLSSIASDVTPWATGTSLGRSLAHGMAQGVYDGSGTVAQAAAWTVQSALAAAQRAAGAYSPSAVFAALGTDLMRGLEQGIAAQVPVVSAQLQAAVSAPALTPAYAAAGGPTVQNFSFNMGGNTIQGGMDQSVFEARVLRIIRANI